MTEAVGTLAEEAAKLLGAAEEWWRSHAPSPEHAGPECRVCPFCQVVSVVRRVEPDVVEKVTEAAVALLVALKGAVETPDAEPRRADVPVERIDIA